VAIAPDDDSDVTMGPVRVELGGARSSRRFAPGSIIAGRYRLIALLGKGGMGEVYRAEDLTLEQQVALKFLPERADRDDPAALAQFHNELRVARQVSHKNVCRLYDLGEYEGRRFLTMEYVDGEILRRSSGASDAFHQTKDPTSRVRSAPASPRHTTVASFIAI
jgi:serine/threonine-protein kinase